MGSANRHVFRATSRQGEGKQPHHGRFHQFMIAMIFMGLVTLPIAVFVLITNHRG